MRKETSGELFRPEETEAVEPAEREAYRDEQIAEMDPNLLEQFSAERRKARESMQARKARQKLRRLFGKESQKNLPYDEEKRQK